MDTSQQVGAKRKKKNRPAQKGACSVSKDTSQTQKSLPGSGETKTQLGQPVVVKKNCPQGHSSSIQPAAAKVVLTQVPAQPEKQQAQEVQPGEVGQKKKKKKKKKPKQPSSEQHVAAASAPGRPSEPSESGCCKLKNLREITCLELICPHSNKPAAKASSAGDLSAAPPSKCPQPEVAANALTQNHLESLSDAIVKSLASLDKTSISITLVNPDGDSVASEKVVHALHEAPPGPNSQIVIDICGTSVIDLEKERGMTSKLLQNNSGMMPSGDSANTKTANKKNKDGGGTKVTNNHAVSIDADRSSQKHDGKVPKVSQKQAKPSASQTSEPPFGHPKKETDLSANKDVVTVASGAAPGTPGEKTKAQLKAERKAAFEAENAARLSAQKADGAAERSRAELKAQRRAQQDAQRAAKAQSTANKPSKPSELSTAPMSQPKKAEGGHQEQPNVQAQEAKRPTATKKAPPRQHEVLRLFSHLHQCPGTVDHLKSYGLSGSHIHPVVFRTGLQIAEGVIVGSNARCIAMLSAFRSLIEDYTCDASKRISQDLREQLDKNTEFLNKCRPLSMSMQNAVTFLKGHISEIQDTQLAGEVKANLVNWVNKFVHEEIFLAKKQITEEAQQKIMDEDVILTYCCSSLVKSVLKMAFESGKKFRVIIVDSRPQFRGRDMLNYLSSIGISCTYVLITAVSYIMKEVTKVLLGASCLLANGYVMGHIGASQIALVAKSRNVPVLVCCETYKFSERVITDSFALNELGPTSQLVSSLPPGIKTDSLKDLPSLSFLNLMYDVTAPQFVDMVITEKGILPCTSVPVVLRMRNTAGQ